MPYQQPSECGPDERYDADQQTCVPSGGGGPDPNPPTPYDPAADESCRMSGGTYANGVCTPVPGAVPGGNIQGSNGGDYGSFGLPDYNWFDYNFDPGDAPAFHAPKFDAPTAESVLNEPGYQFRLGQGEQALQASAAGRGVLRTGGTLKGITEYGQNFASQEYGNAFNRALQSYDRLYQGARDEYTPGLLSWQARGSAKQHALDMSGADQWRKYLADLDFNKFVLGLGN